MCHAAIRSPSTRSTPGPSTSKPATGGRLSMPPSMSTARFPDRAGLPPDIGRAKGAQQVRDDEFNCLSRYSDARPEDCPELRFMIATGADLEGAFKPSLLRNIAKTNPYMHAGHFASLQEVLEHYNRAPAAPV